MTVLLTPYRGIDYMLQARLADGRAKEAEQKLQSMNVQWGGGGGGREKKGGEGGGGKKDRGRGKGVEVEGQKETWCA